ncbi:MAG: hypothetical protein QGH85_01195 [Candidatus Pacebacteria bacterium]|nr:hypothetical protein [Candidatus Paceibacterota bacterium]MDP7159613.1 hypothetical protein [Candidatus Paceibacterota bacterium]MDP7366332.1 hypothetical protein [Candidatus Paceibacterota bacterium]MDP7466221.1 hypothetical protein [Candidatus Paceibacterota bacterium]MDP7648521.1 hypothetical protein [Candidatus Paceibacterota bacterium]
MRKFLLLIFTIFVITVFCHTEKATAETLNMLVTAYCPCEKCCGESSDGRTSKNDDAYICDGVAADPKAIPYRTKLKIPGAGIKEVDDTGGAMRQSWRKKGIYHIDLRFSNHQDALNWGRQQLDVEILK